MKSILNRIKGMISPSKLVKDVLDIAKKPAETALEAALVSQGISVPHEALSALVDSVIGVIEAHV